VHSCVRGEIPVHLRDDDVGPFFCEENSLAFTRGMMISVDSCVRGRI